MPKTVKYIRQMMEKVESQNADMIREKGKDYSYSTEVQRNDVNIKIQRSIEFDVEWITVKRFGTTVLDVMRKLSGEQSTGANISVTLHPGGYSASDRDCIWNVLDALYAHQVTNVTARGGAIQLHYNRDGEQGVIECRDGGTAELFLR